MADLSWLTKEGITEEEAQVILHQAKKEAEYRAMRIARERARDLAYEKKTPLEKLKVKWDRVLRQYKWEAKC